MTMTRKEFLKGAAFTVVVLGSGCPAGGTPPDCGATVELNHGHVLAVPQADVTAGVEQTYHVQGTADHDHTVTITAAQFADLAAGTPVMVLTSPDIGIGTHDHNVTVNCA